MMKKIANQTQKSNPSLEDIMREDTKVGSRGELIAIVMAAVSLRLSLLRLQQR